MVLTLCPCAPCHEEAGDGVPVKDSRIKRKHVKEIQNGTRKAYTETSTEGNNTNIDYNELKQGESTNSTRATSSNKSSGVSQTADSLFSCDVVASVSDGRVSATGAETILKSMNRHYGDQLRDQGFSPPPSFYKAKKQTFGKNEAKWISRDYCPNCGKGFAISSKDVICARCNKATRYDDTTGQAVCQAFYADLDDKVCRIMESNEIGTGDLRFGIPKPLECASIEDRELVDVFDGRAMEEFYHKLDDDHKDNFLYFILCQDGVEITKNVSYTPVTAKLLNWSSKMRSLLGNIILLGFFPPHVKDYTAMLAPIANMFAQHQPGNVPVEVTDRNGATANAWYYLAVTVTDIRGCPAVSCGSSPPCYVGGCNACEIKGTKPLEKGAVIMPGAVRAVKRTTKNGQRLRLSYSHEFKNIPSMKEYHMLGWPKKRKHEDAVKEGQTEEERVGNKVYAKSSLSKARKNLAFHGVDAFSKVLRYWDKIRCVVYDQAHEHANVIKQIINLIQDKQKKGKCLFNATVRQQEAKLRPGMKKYANNVQEKKKGDKNNLRRYTHKRPDWQADKDGKARLDALKDICRVPSVFPPMRKWLKNVGFVKCTEWYLLTGDAGAYFIRASGIRGQVRTLWIKLLRLMEMIMRKVSTPGDREYIKEHLPQLLAALEIELPLSWNTSVVHIFACQTVRILEEWGPFSELSMLDFERYHTKFKALARSSNELMTSISNTYKLQEACADTRHSMNSADQAKLSKPLRSTTHGLQSQKASSDKTDRCTSVLGRGVAGHLTDAELVHVNRLWDIVPEVDGNNTNTSILIYNRAEYAGNTFCTAWYRKRARTKIDNTHVRLDYKIRRGSGRSGSGRGQNQQRVVSIFGTIVRIFKHQFADTSINKIILQCRWFKTIGTCSIAGTTLVQEDLKTKSNNLDPEDQFTFLETVFQLPVAVWPHNEASGGAMRPGGETYDIIDRNQEQYDDLRDNVDVLDSPDIVREDIEGVEEVEEEIGETSNRRKQQTKRKRSVDNEEMDDDESSDNASSDESSDEAGQSSDEDADSAEQQTGIQWDGNKDTICSFCFQTVQGTPTAPMLSCTACPRVYHNECAKIAPAHRKNKIPVLCHKLSFVTATSSEQELVQRLEKCTNRANSINE
jgi:hypothetical protein